MNCRVFPTDPFGRGPTNTLLASYALAINGVPLTGWPLYSTVMECAPTSRGVNSAVNPLWMLPVTLTGSSVVGPDRN